MFTIADVIKLLTRIFVKENKRFPKGLEGVDIRLKAHKIHDVAKSQGYTGGIGENQLKHFLALEKQAQGPTIRGHRIISGDSPEGKKITEDLFGKKGEVVDMTGKKIDTSKPILGGKNVEDVVTETVTNMKKMTPIDAMKEANSVIAKKGKYKTLTPAESKKILKDTEDHIFERDIKPDPEDFAGGGVAGLLGERTGYKEGIGPSDQPMGPPFETDDPKKAVKEVIKRLIKLEGANIPISEKLSIALGPSLDQAEIRGVLDILGGELSFSGGMKGDDRGIGFNFLKQFQIPYAYGGIAGMLGERTNYAEGGNGKDDSMVGISMSIEERWKRILEILKQMEDVRSGKTTDPKYDPEDKAMGGRIGYAGGYMVDDEEEDTDYARAIRALSYRPKAQEGGLMDLGGMEKDYRNEGGFVPIGGQERADDVPARLSKNEFVFTADAVRAAGGGDIDAGAEVMENVMENLEQGGQVSEESQGLEGARNMFATAQRLEGVL